MFCYQMPSFSHELSLLVETRKTVLTEIRVENVMFMYMFPYVAYTNVFHNFAEDACQ